VTVAAAASEHVVQAEAHLSNRAALDMCAPP
jgi:hypothetical protein